MDRPTRDVPVIGDVVALRGPEERPDDEFGLDELPTILFMHIPKTGGTSVRLALEDAYAREERVYIYNEPPGISEAEFRARPAGQRTPALVFGHFHYGLHDAVPGPSRYVTMLREPVERVASLYAMYRHTRPDWTDGLSLEEWVFSGRSIQSDNEMARQIAGRRRIPFGQCPDDLLDEAFNNIKERFAAVLVPSARTAQVLQEVLRRPVHSIGRTNVGVDRPLIEDPAVRRRIAEFNRLDVALYERFA